MDPITIAMGLAQFAPTIIKWITGSDKAEAAATKVVEIAGVVTGQQGDAALKAIAADPNLAMQFRMAVLANEADLDKAFLADVQNARNRDVELAKTGQGRNLRAEAMFLLAVVMIVLMVFIIWRDPQINEYMKGIFTLVLGRFLGYLDNIYNFEFGSTRTSQTKDATIKNLSQG